MNRRLIVTCVALLGCAEAVAAQRLSSLAPGTLVRITTTDGERVVGPLALVRGDTILLSTTPSDTARVIALSRIRAVAYQDGKDFHGRRGALIGAVIGATLGLVTSLADTKSDYRVTPRQAATILGVLGTGIGGFIGLASGTPHWVDACSDVAQQRASHDAPGSVSPPSGIPSACPQHSAP